MQFEQETGWSLHPLQGETGHAYMGIKDQEKLFVKLNTSPFLAALSLEGISPRLVWTKRIGNGDVLTAQEWCNGRNLNKKEMQWDRVAHILRKVHTSRRLRKMLKNVGGKKTRPQEFLDEVIVDLPAALENHPTVNNAIQILLENDIRSAKDTEFVVCHGDTSHKNWLLSDEDQLYLVDWDSVILADPAYDIGQLLSRYIDNENWKTWLSNYENTYTKEFKERVKWYSVISSLQDIKNSYKKQQFSEMNQAILKLDDLLK